MMHALRRWGIIGVAAVIAGLFEATFSTFLPTPWREIRPILDGAILLVVLNRPKYAFVFAAITGIILDVIPVEGSGFASARLIAIVALVMLLVQTVLTNRSVYATALLMVTARAADRVWLSVVSFLLRFGSGPAMHLEPLRFAWITLAWDIGLVSLGFISFAFFTRRFLMPITRFGSYE